MYALLQTSIRKYAVIKRMGGCRSNTLLASGVHEPGFIEYDQYTVVKDRLSQREALALIAQENGISQAAVRSVAG